MPLEADLIKALTGDKMAGGLRRVEGEKGGNKC